MPRRNRIAVLNAAIAPVDDYLSATGAVDDLSRTVNCRFFRTRVRAEPAASRFHYIPAAGRVRDNVSLIPRHWT